MDEFRKVLMSFSFEKLLSPEASITSAANSQGNPQIGITLLKRLFMDESEELKSSNVIQRQAWQVFDLHNQLLSLSLFQPQFLIIQFWEIEQQILLPLQLGF